jgi:hypothetical protein
VLRKIIFRIHDEEIRGRLVPPLKPDVHVRVIEQVVILKIGRQEKIMRKSKIDPWTDKKQLFLAVILRKLHIIIIQRNISIGLIPNFQLGVYIEVCSVIEAAIGRLKNVIKDPARVTFESGGRSIASCIPLR